MAAERVVIGVDCATDDCNIGLALARWTTEACTVDDVQLCGRGCSPASVLSPWLNNASNNAIVAIDAPLGWPTGMSSALMGHSAGQPLSATAHEMFRRTTDRRIKEKLGKTPLDVGADRIARTAHSALSLLHELRLLGHSMELAWEPVASSVGVIEVYPAATLKAHGWRSAGYKKAKQDSERKEILEGLESLLRVSATKRELLLQNADALDAVVCVLAGKDFLDGNAVPPDNRSLADKEGWIWVREATSLEPGKSR